MMTKQSFRIIKPLKAGAAPVVLKDSYGTPTNLPGILDINASSDEGERQKELFLNDAVRYLSAVGQALHAYGFEEINVRKNRAGIAVSGEVYAEIRKPGMERWLFVWIESSCCRFLAPTRRDGVLITARWREPTKVSARDGDHHHFEPGLSSFALAHRLVPIVGLEVRPDVLLAPSSKNEKPAIARKRRSPATSTQGTPLLTPRQLTWTF